MLFYHAYEVAFNFAYDTENSPKFGTLSGALAGATFRCHKGLSRCMWGGIAGGLLAGAYQFYDNRVHMSFDLFQRMYPARNPRILKSRMYADFQHEQPLLKE